MIRKICRSIILREKADSNKYIKYLRKKGCSIGKGTVIYVPQNTLIDTTRPWLITIGNDVKITEGVKIQTHGFDWSVLAGAFGEVLGSAGKVWIGNNVFIGMNSVILKGTTIGDNTIIAAGSICSGNYPGNAVYMGQPAKKYMDLTDYLEKRRDSQMNEAIELTLAYKAQFGKWPEEEKLSEFFWLFHPRGNTVPDYFKQKMICGGTNDHIWSVFLNRQPEFPDYHAFVSECMKIDDLNQKRHPDKFDSE